MTDRKHITASLTKAAVGYFVKKTYGVNTELGVTPWGRRKVDVVAINMKGHIVVCEVKSGLNDLKTDSKMHEYLPFCNQMYLVVTETFYEQHNEYIRSRLIPELGLLVLGTKTGLLSVKKNSPTRVMERHTKRTMILKLAWRGAKFSKRNSKRYRVFIED